MTNNAQIIPLIKNIIPKDAKSVLCLGCGHHQEGFFTNADSRKYHDILATCFDGFEITGVDIYPRVLEYREQFGPEGTYILGDIRDIKSIVSQKFDVVICHHVIEHLPKEDGHMLIKNCEELANQLVIFGAPNGFIKAGDAKNKYMEHLSGWKQEEFVGYDVHFNKDVFLVSKKKQ